MLVCSGYSDPIDTPGIRRQRGIKPLFPYQGSKRGHVHKFKHLLRRSDTYIETHFGTGAVFCYMYNNKLFNTAIINDNQNQLINIYISIKERYSEFVYNVSEIIADYNSLPNSTGTHKRPDGSRINLTAKTRLNIKRGDQEFTKKHCYYEYLSQYQLKQNPEILFFLLLVRFGGAWDTINHKFGNSYSSGAGECNRNIALDIDNLNLWHEALQCTTIYCCDYSDVPIPAGDILIYCDPVYYNAKKCYEQPEMAKANEQLRILDYFKNHATVISNISDGIFFEIISPKFGYKINYFDAKHFGHPDQGWKEVTELLLISRAYYSNVGKTSEQEKIQPRPVTYRNWVPTTFPHRVQPSLSLRLDQRSLKRRNPSVRLRFITTGIPPPDRAASCRCNPSPKFLPKFEVRIATAIAGFFEIVDRPSGGQPPPIASNGTGA